VRRLTLIPVLTLFFFLPSIVLVIGYTNITVSVAKNMIDSTPSLIALDVRTQSEYDSGHIRNAKHIPVGELEGRLDELEHADEILVYCRSGGRSATASQILADNGFSQVYNMLGGITAWIDAGYPVYVKYSSIQEAINSADGGDTIYVSSGTYYEHIVVNKSISLIGEDKYTTVIDGNGEWMPIVHIFNVSDIIVHGFTVENTTSGMESYGISTYQARNVTIQDNFVTEAFYGILLHSSTECKILNNEISESYNAGIVLRGESINNSVIGNLISNNPNGILASDFSSEYNTFFHNNIINNTNQVTLFSNFFTWDNGCEGNYWSNYNGTDLDSDGIGDTYLPWEAVDNYPLMNLYWNPADVNHDLKVDIYDVVLACSAYTSTPSDPHWNPHCDIAEPYGVIDIYDIVMICTSYGEEYNP